MTFEDKKMNSLTFSDQIPFDFNTLPNEIVLRIFSHLEVSSLARCLRVNKIWQVLANDQRLWESLYVPHIFGEKEWIKYFGFVKASPIPRSIYPILESDCPFWKGKKVKETHICFLIPESVNNQTFTLKKLEKLVKLPKQGYPTKYKHIWKDIFKNYGSLSPSQSYWVLMTKDILDESKNKTYQSQQILVESISKKTKTNYQIPYLLEVVTGLFITYVRFKICLPSLSSTFTRCQEDISSYHLAAGGFNENGLSVVYNDAAYKDFGVIALRKVLT